MWASSWSGCSAREPRLSVSVVLPATAATTCRDIGAFARHAEQAGLDGIFTGDHLAAAAPRLDASIVLAIAASATSRVKIGFGVMVLALRGPAWAAKQVATLQALSGERVILGVGAGGGMHGTAAWDAVGIPSSERGRATDAGVSHLVVGLVGEDWPAQCDLLAQARAALPA